jgi:regulator of sigma E protease
VDEFAIGFPPRLFSVKRGETEYSLNALPIGGYVKILGENGDEAEELTPEDKLRTFSARPKWAQALVLIAGVTMNVLLAWVILVGLLLGGTSVQVDEATAGTNATLTVLGTAPLSPASVLPVQAEIVGVSRGEATLSMLTPAALVAFVEAGQGAPVTISYQLPEGPLTTVTITPEVGIDSTRPDTPLLGLQTGLIEERSYGLGAAVVEGTKQTVGMINAITVGLVTLLSQAIVGQADLSQVAGPVGIVEHVGKAASFGFDSLLLLTAIISLNLAVINLFPIPALDGGRLVFVAIEAITRRPINPVWAGRVNLVGFGLLLLLMVAVTFSDIMKLL